MIVGASLIAFLWLKTSGVCPKKALIFLTIFERTGNLSNVLGIQYILI